MLLSAESLYAISSASTLMNATTARPVGGTPLSASLAQAKSWTTTACLMKNHLCWRGPLYTLAQSASNASWLRLAGQLELASSKAPRIKSQLKSIPLYVNIAKSQRNCIHMHSTSGKISGYQLLIKNRGSETSFLVLFYIFNSDIYMHI